MVSKKKNRTLDIEIKIPETVSGIIYRNYGQYLVDDSLPDINVLLLSIYLIEYNNKKSGAIYDECKKLFILLGRREDNYRKIVHKAKKDNLIEERERTLYFLSKGLKRIRQLLGQIEKAPVYIIKSGQNFTAIRLLEEFLMTEIKEKEVLLCDSHISHSTLYPFAILKGKIELLKILTANIYDSNKLKEYKKKMEKEMGIVVEIKVNKKIHDRYLISGKKCWHFGASIKDLGNKDTTIKEISEVVASMRELFEERWKEV